MAKVQRAGAKARGSAKVRKVTRKRKASPAQVAADVERLENGVTEAEVMEYFNQLDEQHAEMEEDAASHRGDINATYDRACDALGVVKEALTFSYSERRRRMKAEKKAGKWGSQTRESTQKLAQALGGSLGDYLTRVSQAEPQKEAGAE